MMCIALFKPEHWQYTVQFVRSPLLKLAQTDQQKMIEVPLQPCIDSPSNLHLLLFEALLMGLQIVFPSLLLPSGVDAEFENQMSHKDNPEIHCLMKLE